MTRPTTFAIAAAAVVTLVAAVIGSSRAIGQPAGESTFSEDGHWNRVDVLGPAVPTPTPLPLGTFTLGSVETTDCPSSVSGWTCYNFQVSCPSTENLNGFLAVKLSSAPIKAGMIVHYSGDNGNLWWDGSPNPTSFSTTYFNNMTAAGYDVVQVRWSGSGWTFSQLGVQTGQKLLSCRPATVSKWVHDNLWTTGTRYILTGGSGGSSQVAYSMLYLYSPNIVDLLIPDSGPVMADMFDGCVTGGIYDYTNQKALIDSSYGFATNTGPCFTSDAGYTATWFANSNETCGPNYLYPGTVVHMLEGADDGTGAPQHATKYQEVLLAAGQSVQYETVAGMGHVAIGYATGEAALEAAILAATPIPTPTATPTATATPDYVLYKASTRQTAIWYLNNNVYIGGAYGPTLPTGWNVIDVADFNRDAHPDYLLYNGSTRQTAIWYLNNSDYRGGAYGPSVPTGWQPVATADFNGDGKPDYALYNSSTRQTAIWYLNNNVYVSGVYGPTLPIGWRLVGSTDFDGDRKPDYLLFNSITRQSAIWYLNNNVFISGVFGPTIASGWALVVTADFNSDGHPDYVLYNPANRQTAIWYLNNNVYISAAYGPTPPAGWSLIAP